MRLVVRAENVRFVEGNNIADSKAFKRHCTTRLESVDFTNKGTLCLVLY